MTGAAAGRDHEHREHSLDRGDGRDMGTAGTTGVCGTGFYLEVIGSYLSMFYMHSTTPTTTTTTTTTTTAPARGTRARR
jgi:hypothetical protein